MCIYVCMDLCFPWFNRTVVSHTPISVSLMAAIKKVWGTSPSLQRDLTAPVRHSLMGFNADLTLPTSL